jgi:hypothetical protein
MEKIDSTLKSFAVPLSYRGALPLLSFDVDAIQGTLPYNESTRDYEPRCHWGQLKLLLSEWEFLNATRDIYSRGETVVVYAGAANGAHIPFLADLFPEIRCFYLFDGAKFDRGVDAHPRIKTFSGTAGFVTDATVPQFRALARGASILFISDIRTVPSEARVRDDMIAQARWGVDMGAEAMLLKFRPPYAIGKANAKRASVPSAEPGDFPANARDVVEGTSQVPIERRMLYLDGRVQPQLFAPMNSTEARLYARPSANGRYQLAYYDVQQHEEESYFYNISTRRLSLVSLDPPLDRYLPGFDLGWESVQAFNIAMEHARVRGLDARDAVRMLADMLMKLSRSTGGRGLVTCLSETLEKYEKKNQGRRGYETRRLALWRRLVRVQEKEMAELQKRRILQHAVSDGVFSREEAEKLVGLLDVYSWRQE